MASYDAMCADVQMPSRRSRGRGCACDDGPGRPRRSLDHIGRLLPAGRGVPRLAGRDADTRAPKPRRGPEARIRVSRRPQFALPASALAHGLAGGYNPNRPVPEYLWLGFWHMVAGWDHLLFIAGVVLLSETVRTAAKLISLFAAGHSLTLLTATLAGWRLDPTLVDAVIALSLVYVGVQGL